MPLEKVNAAVTTSPLSSTKSPGNRLAESGRDSRIILIFRLAKNVIRYIYIHNPGHAMKNPRPRCESLRFPYPDIKHQRLSLGLHSLWSSISIPSSSTSFSYQMLSHPIKPGTRINFNISPKRRYVRQPPRSTLYPITNPHTSPFIRQRSNKVSIETKIHGNKAGPCIEIQLCIYLAGTLPNIPKPSPHLLDGKISISLLASTRIY